jgi:hypothetical protein
MRVAKFVPTLMVLALVAGCGGGQTGDLSGQNEKKGGSNANGNGCEDQLREISLDDASALGFDAQSVLSFAEQGYQTELAWQVVDRVEYSPSAGQSALTLSLSSLNEAWLVHSVPAASTNDVQGGALVGVICPPDRLRIAVHAALQSADGALAESFNGSLEARSSSVATLRHGLDPKSISGSFAIEHVTPPEGLGPASASVDNLGLDAVLTPGGMAGTLSGQLVTIGSQVAGSSVLTFARFPSTTRCSGPQGSSGVGVPVSAESAALGQTGTEALTQVNGRGSLALAWGDGPHSTLTLALSGLADGCVQVASSAGFADPALPAATVVYPYRWQQKPPMDAGTASTPLVS